MKKYTIVQDTILESFEKRVNEKLENGYYIVGQAFSHTDKTDDVEKNYYCQTMGLREV